MKKEEKIKVIYEKIADKTLSFWCRIILKNYLWEKIVNQSIWNLTYIFWFEHPFLNKDISKKQENQIEKIIWHPIMIWKCDILIEKWPNYFDEWIKILDLWEKKDDPIENQNEKCIDYIYNLITNDR